MTWQLLLEKGLVVFKNVCQFIERRHVRETVFYGRAFDVRKPVINKCLSGFVRCIGVGFKERLNHLRRGLTARAVAFSSEQLIFGTIWPNLIWPEGDGVFRCFQCGRVNSVVSKVILCYSRAKV